MLRLADEESACRESLDRSHSRSACFRRPDDRAFRKLPAQEGAGLRHDQIGLKVLAARVHVEVGEKQPVGRVGQRRHWIRNRVARRVVPGLEVRGLGGADAEQDAENFQAGHPLSE